MHGLRTIIRPVVAAMVDHTRRWGRVCGGDRGGTVAFQAILAGNIAHLPYRDADGRLTGLDVADQQRRPVSVLALATSIDMPYESVRVRVRRLEAEGIVERTAAGLVVSLAILASPKMRAEQVADRSALAGIARILLGVGYPVPPELTVAAIEALPPAVAARLFLDFMLRAIETQPKMHGDFVNGAIIAAIVSANVRHLMADPAFALRHADRDQPPPDIVRRPIALRSLAREMELPFETLRRRVRALAAAGEVRLSDAGAIVPAALLMQPRFRRNNIIIARQFRRLLGDVVRLG